jgi:hypothetical protein
MFPFPIARPQGCNIQIFYGASGAKAWNKPVGVSHVYMLTIGNGANGNTTSGGGSGAVTVWFGAAQHVPDTLRINSSTILYYAADGTSVTLVFASSGSGATGGATISPAGGFYFLSSGFYQSTAGQDGVSSGNQDISTSTFLSGGTAPNTDTVTGNYGYSLTAATTDLNGIFLTRPIIVGLGGKAGGKGGIGCGGGSTGTGGQAMVLIASW